MATPPGSAGYTVVGDKSVEFYRDANAFVDRRIAQHNSPIFLTRLMNKPTVCVASNRGVRQVLCDQSHHIELGYKSLMQSVYGDNVLFYEADEAQQLRSVLHTLFSPDSVATFQSTIDSLTKKSIDELQKGDPDSVYDFFKKLATEICLSVFLDIDFHTSQELASDVVDLTTLHWHGIISVPMSLKLPMMQTSGFGKALEAKSRLLEIIDKKLSNGSTGFPRQVSQAKFPSRSVASGNLLLFTSALVPKALASILTSFVLALSGDETLQETTRFNEDLLRCVLMEVQRLWPPFVGGRRLVRQDCEVEGYRVPSGHAIVYLTRHAQRDPEVFDEPNEFRPERWQNKNKYDKDKLFLYGAGPRGCIGRELVKRILKTVTTTLIENYSWSSPAGPDQLPYKWLPVSRPQDGAPIHFTHLGTETAL